MLLTRIAVSFVIIPLVLFFIFAGGWVLAVGAALVIGVASWEFWRMAHHGGLEPSEVVLIAGGAGMIIARHLFSFQGTDLLASFLVLVAMAFHTFRYESGRNQAAVDFAVTMSGLFYLGWLGTYFISLRSIPDGQYWMLLALPAAWFSDIGAFFVGIRFGKHRLSKRVSPKKSWEGYLAGIPSSILGTMLLGAIWHTAAPAITLEKAALLGLIMGVLAPLGDLGESMLKRQFALKDTSNLLPGHGGMMDRIDSSLWAGVIGYYIITMFLI